MLILIISVQRNKSTQNIKLDSSFRTNRVLKEAPPIHSARGLNL